MALSAAEALARPRPRIHGLDATTRDANPHSVLLAPSVEFDVLLPPT